MLNGYTTVGEQLRKVDAHIASNPDSTMIRQLHPWVIDLLEYSFKGFEWWNLSDGLTYTPFPHEEVLADNTFTYFWRRMGKALTGEPVLEIRKHHNDLHFIHYLETMPKSEAEFVYACYTKSIPEIYKNITFEYFCRTFPERCFERIPNE